jgi:NADPH:quinone reductase-like Zn-dependent oxidoreductase
VRAIVVREAGDPPVLRLEELPAPSPGPDEVTVDVAFAGTGFVDTLGTLLNDFGRGVSRAAAACADVVLSSGFDGWIADPANAPDVVIDPVGGELRVTAFKHLAPFGRQIVLGNASGDDRSLSGDGSWRGSRTVSGLPLGAAVHQAFADRTAPPKAVLDVSA